MSTKDTQFKGPVSLSAIFDAKSSKKPKLDKKTVEEITEPTEITPTLDTEVIKETDTPVLEESVEIKDDKSKEPQISSESHQTALNLISLGLLEDISISTGEEEFLVSEFFEMTDENLKEIVNLHKKSQKKNISDNYISKDGLQEYELKVIEILKNGGDLSDIAATEEDAFNLPFSDVDLENQQDQVDILFFELTNENNPYKMDKDLAIETIRSIAKKGELKSKSESVVEKYQQAYKDTVDKKLEEQKKKKDIKEFNFTENKKVLRNKLKEAGLKETAYKKVIGEYNKKDAKGNHLLLEKFKEALNNPKENYELILHLADKKLFEQIFNIKSAHETAKTVVTLASTAQSKGNRKLGKSVQPSKEVPWKIGAQAYNNTIIKTK